MDGLSVAGDDLTDLLLDHNAETIFAVGGTVRGLGEKLGQHARSLFATKEHQIAEGDRPEDRFEQEIAKKPQLASTWNRLQNSIRKQNLWVL